MPDPTKAARRDRDLHLRCGDPHPVDHPVEADQRLDALAQAATLGASPEALGRLAAAAARHWKAEQLEAGLLARGSESRR